MSDQNPCSNSSAFNNNSNKVIVDANHDLFPGYRPPQTSLSFPTGLVIPLFGIDSHIFTTHELFEMQLGNMSLQSGTEMPSAVVSSLFKGLLTGDVPNETSLYQPDIIRSILPRLQVEILERHDGELIDDFERLLGTSPRDTSLQVIRFALYFSSNNMLGEEQLDNFLSWMVNNGQRAMSIFRDLLCYKLPTVEACVHAIFRRAVQVQNVAVAKAIIESDFDVSMVIKSADEFFTEAIYAEDLELIQLLLKAGAKFDRWELQEAIGTGNTELARLFLPSSADMQKWSQMEEGRIYLKYPATLFRYATTAKMVQLLLDLGVDANGAAWDSSEGVVTTPLHAAIKNSDDSDDTYDIDVIKTLIRSGANVNATAPDNSGSTPLMTAILYEKTGIVKELLESGAQVDIYGSDPDFPEAALTELQLAAGRGLYDVVEMLLNAGADVNKPAAGDNGTTALLAAAEYDDESIVQLLLDAGAHVNAPGNPGTKYPRSPLLAAVQAICITKVKTRDLSNGIFFDRLL
jgi:hypothetical protein